MEEQQILGSKKLNFEKVENPALLLPVLEERLPQICFMYNQVKSYERFKDDTSFYILGTEINSDTWIVCNYLREDYGMNISISAPTPVVEGKVSIPLEVKESFSLWKVFQWDQGMLFVSMVKAVSSMIIDLSANVKGCVTEIHPCLLYYMEIEKALSLDITHGPEVTEIRRLLPDTETEFIVSTWNYSKEGTSTVVRKCLAANASAGVFVDGKCVSGVLTPGIGLQSSLYTLKEYRKRGYAKLVMQYAFREYARDGCIPSLTVELQNEGSIAFHQSLGVKPAAVVDWVDVKRFNID